MTVRSARLADGYSDPPGTPQTLYTCPSGVTALLKDVRIDPSNSTPTRALVRLSSGPGQVAIHDGPLGEFECVAIQGFMVLEPGDTIQIYAEGGAFGVILSGAELVGVAP